MQENQTTENTQDTNNVPKKTEAEFVELFKREYYEIQSIDENIADLKEKAKSAGYDAAMLAKVSKALAESKTDDIIAKNEKFADLAEKVRNS